MAIESISRRLGLLLVLIVGLSGCGYGEVGDHAYEHAMALYSICNRRDEARLTLYSETLAKANEAGELTPREADWLIEIAALAEAGQWDEASTRVRRLMMDQVQSTR